MARVSDARSGRSFELWSNQPGLQFYSGNFLDGTACGKAGQLYQQGDAIVLEPQAFPDTVNQATFGDVRLALARPIATTSFTDSAAERRFGDDGVLRVASFLTEECFPGGWLCRDKEFMKRSFARR